MFKNMKLVFKIGGGFSLLLILAIVIAVNGITGLFSVGKSVEKGDDANRIVKEIQDIRLTEKNYIMRGSEEYISEMSSKIDHLAKTLDDSKAKLKDITAIERIDSIKGQVNNYKTAFDEYVFNAGKEKEAEEIMTESARIAEAKAEEIRQEQKKEYADLYARKAAPALLNDKMTKADDANRIIKWIIQSRRHEKNFQLRRDEKYISDLEADVSSIITLAEDMRQRFSQTYNKDQVDEIIKVVDEYRMTFRNLVSSHREMQADEEKMLETARASVSMATEARAVQKEKMNKGIKDAVFNMIISVIVSTVAGITLSIIITLSITRGLIKGVRFAEIMAKGDLTSSVDLDQKDEVGQLALSLNKMSEKLHEVMENIISSSKDVSQGGGRT